MEFDPALQQLDSSLWAALDRATTDRHHDWRTCAFGTHRLSGLDAPSMRMVVLRDVDRRARTLVFFTDVRSDKIAELGAVPRASLLFWNAKANWQLRMQAQIAIITEGAEFEARWQQVKATRGALDYQSVLRPGAPLADVTNLPDITDLAETPASAPKMPEQATQAPAKLPVQQPASSAHHFAMLRATVTSCDSLELRREGHRRALFDYVQHTRTWLQP